VIDARRASGARTNVGVAAFLVLLLDGAQVVAQRSGVARDGGRQVQHPQRRRRRVVKVLAVRLRARNEIRSQYRLDTKGVRMSQRREEASN